MASSEKDIHFACAVCNQGLVVDAEGAGMAFDCPECGAVLTVPHELETKQYRDTEVLMRAPAFEPSELAEFCGQLRVRSRIELALLAAKKRQEPIPHILLTGAPGMGKRTLSQLIAKRVGGNHKVVSGGSIETAGDLAGLLINLDEGDTLIVQNLDQLRKQLHDYFRPALINFQLDLKIDQGANARSVRLNLPQFTCIGLTTDKDRLSPGVLSCFTITEALTTYTAEELTLIADRFANSLCLRLEKGVSQIVANSANGLPSQVLSRLRHVRDYAEVNASPVVSQVIAAEALKLLATNASKNVGFERVAIPSDVRREVWRRDQGTCAKCGSREKLEYDHIIPVAKGGSNTARNIELLCETCNRAKQDHIQ